MLRQQFDYSVLFPWNPRTAVQQINNTGAQVTYTLGLVLGRVQATGYLTPCVSTATDGSQIPLYVLANTIIIPAATIANVTVLTSGDIVAPGLIFENGTDTLTTNVAYNTSGDIIGSFFDILTGRGLRPVPSTDGTFYDN